MTVREDFCEALRHEVPHVVIFLCLKSDQHCPPGLREDALRVCHGIRRVYF